MARMLEVHIASKLHTYRYKIGKVVSDQGCSHVLHYVTMCIIQQLSWI